MYHSVSWIPNLTELLRVFQLRIKRNRPEPKETCNKNMGAPIIISDLINISTARWDSSES